MSSELKTAEVKPRVKKIKVRVDPESPGHEVTATPDQAHMGHQGPVQILWVLEGGAPHWQFKEIAIEPAGNTVFYDHGVGRDASTGVATAWVWNKNNDQQKKAYKYSIVVEHTVSRKILELDPSIVNRSDG